MNNFKKLFYLLLLTPSQKGDVAIWLQGDRYDRGKKILELYNNGLTKKIVLTGNNKLLNSKLRPGEKNISLRSMYTWLKKRGVKEKNIIIEDKSFNTKDQSENIVLLAKKKRWSSILLVASSYHQPRAFLTFLKSASRLKWKGLIINQPFFIEENKIPSGKSETTKKLFFKENKKIILYKNDLFNTVGALRYIKKNFIRVRLRKVKLSDAEFLFDLRNDFVTRKNSFSQKKIKIEDHLNWLKKVLASNRKIFYIIIDKKRRSVGQVRFDVLKNTAEISVSIKNKFRKKGFGKEAVGYSSLYFLDKFNNFKKIIARIKKDNIPSIKVFKKAGYSFFKKNKDILSFIFNN